MLEADYRMIFVLCPVFLLFKARAKCGLFLVLQDVPVFIIVVGGRLVPFVWAWETTGDPVTGLKAVPFVQEAHPMCATLAVC